MLRVIKWKVGSYWSTVNLSDVAGSLHYYANFEDALKHARENYTVPVRIVCWVENNNRWDYLDKPFEIFK